MSFIRIPNSVGVNIRFTIDGKPSEFGFTIELPTAPIVSTMQTLASGMVDWVNNTLRSGYPPTITFSDVYVIDLNDPAGPAFTWTLGTGADVMPFAGTASGIGSPVPNQSALVCSLRTPNRGRSYRGRIFFPVVSAQYVADALNVSVTLSTLVSAAVTTLPTYLAAVSGTLVVASRYNGGAARAVGVATPVTETIVNTRTDTQRRRARP